jgi:transposase
MNEPLPVAVIVGVDTHKVMHAAVAISNVGARLGEITVPASANGYRDLATRARSLGAIPTFGIEGTGSYGAGLSRFLCEQGLPVLEVSRPNRQMRHRHGKPGSRRAFTRRRIAVACSCSCGFTSRRPGPPWAAFR